MDDTQYAISHVHARGLRRDLFRMLEDRARQGVPAFEKSWEVLRWPYGSAREVKGVFERARKALRACAYNPFGNDTRIDGLLLVPRARLHADGQLEPVIEARTASIAIKRGIPTGKKYTIGTVSHHAVERMFQRMNTTSKEDVLQDMLAFSIWARLLQTVAIVADSGKCIEQIPLPTPHGIFLCVRETDTWEVHMRTWIPHGMSSRHDASVACVVAFCQGIRGDGDAHRLIAEFDAMADRPENRWWRTPHRDAERCPYA